MSIQALDPLRITQFLQPWIAKKSVLYPPLSNPIVSTEIISAIKRGTDQNALEQRLKPWFASTDIDVSKFINKLSKKCKHFSHKDIKTNVPVFKRRNGDLPKRNEQSRSRDNHNKINRGGYQPQRVEPMYQSTPPKIESLPQAPKASVPSYFKSTEQISLRSGIVKQEKVLFNDEGKRVDENGNELIFEGVDRHAKPKPVPVDRRIPTVTRPKAREFNFNEPGVITKEIEEKRDKFRRDLAVVNGLPIFDAFALQRDYEIPAIDWWDIPFVVMDGDKPLEQDGQWVPIDEQPNAEYENTAPIVAFQPNEKEIPTILTPAEKKRLKHIKKLEKENEKRLMIKLRLVEPEPQRLKISSLATMTGKMAAMDPSTIEEMVTKPRLERIAAHEARNAENKLSKEERKEKEAEKRRKDAKESNTVTYVYSVSKLDEPLILDKITRMAKKHFISGGIFDVGVPSAHFVVAECSEKAGRKFEGLMERRIDWGEVHFSKVFQSPPTGESRHFYNFRKYRFDVGTQCMEWFDKYHGKHLFEAAVRDAI